MSKKYRLHKITEKDIEKLEKKTGLDVDYEKVKDTYCLVDKKGKPYMEEGHNLVVYNPKYLAKPQENNEVSNITNAIEAAIYFKTVREMKVKSTKIGEMMVPAGQKTEIKGFSKICGIHVNEPEASNREYLCEMEHFWNVMQTSLYEIATHIDNVFDNAGEYTKDNRYAQTSGEVSYDEERDFFDDLEEDEDYEDYDDYEEEEEEDEEEELDV